MFATIAFVLVTAFAVATVLLPFRFPRLQHKILERLRGVVLCPAGWTGLDVEDAERKSIVCIRLWFATAAVFFVMLGLQDGAVIRNHPASVGTVVVYGIFALGGSSLIILSLVAFSRLVPSLKMISTLSRSGIRGVWVTSLRRPSREWLDDLESRIRNSQHLAILEVTGCELLCRTKDGQGGRLFDMLRGVPDLPVSLLLLNPQAKDVDPDRARATIFQTAVSEMQTTTLVCTRRIRHTLKAVRDLNDERSSGARIEVRFYSEKPTVRAFILDDSMMVAPWLPRSGSGQVAFLDLVGGGSASSLHESFRRDYNRLWIGATSGVILPEGSSRDLQLHVEEVS